MGLIGGSMTVKRIKRIKLEAVSKDAIRTNT
ncbi:hypothetical protein FUAX_27550 [Fulvitalea axinellae]|uniref:Uncharacterized protein n=1 Tax=Fulvitalea axinellae TaxID=1182444 RepID=A0AAU9CQG7_9BACT|nr:hypothetical protein FUAX_27550 [Fulvitalea axinellae]